MRLAFVDIGVRPIIALSLGSALVVAVACGGGAGDGGTGGQGAASASTSISVGAGASLPDGGIPPPHCPDPAAGGQVFYVDGATGSDSAAGTSEQTAWKTIG